MNYKALIAAALVATVVVVQAGTLDESIPKPWFKNGADPAAKVCKAGIDTAIEKAGTPNLTLKCDTKQDGFVGVMQTFAANDYLGKRVRFSALVKATDVEGWAGLWMRIDDKDRPNTAFDNMQNRAITGTSDWTPYSVVLDVSEKASGVFFGTLMIGKGQVWISDLRFDVVGADVPSTDVLGGKGGSTKPGNLSLSR
jgi:hypothetical protein